MTKIVLLQHGPTSDECIAVTCAHLLDCKELLKKHQFSIVFQHYETDLVYAENAQALYLQAGYTPVMVKTADVFNPGFFNINRQVNCVQQALRHTQDDDVIIKLRNDQTVNFKQLFHYLEIFGFFNGPSDKILTTNCFTRKDRLYHPSDMFLCGTSKTLKEYYSLPYQEATHKDVQLRIVEMETTGTPQRISMLAAPESQLFKHFLEIKNWDFQFTDEDSLKALRRYCHMVNSWNIDFHWSKQRTPLVRSGGLILPQNNFTSIPFEGGPTETNACYDECDIYDRPPSLTDRIYTNLSSELFGLYHHPIRILLVPINYLLRKHGLRLLASRVKARILAYLRIVPGLRIRTLRGFRFNKETLGHILAFIFKLLRAGLQTVGSLVRLFLLLPFLVLTNRK